MGLPVDRESIVEILDEELPDIMTCCMAVQGLMESDEDDGGNSSEENFTGRDPEAYSNNPVNGAHMTQFSTTIG